MSEHKHYGIVRDIVGNEGEGIGNLSVTAFLSPSENMPKARIIVGSTGGSPVDLGQFVLTFAQASELVAMLENAMADVGRACPSATRSEP